MLQCHTKTSEEEEGDCGAGVGGGGGTISRVASRKGASQRKAQVQRHCSAVCFYTSSDDSNIDDGDDDDDDDDDYDDDDYDDNDRVVVVRLHCL